MPESSQASQDHAVGRGAVALVHGWGGSYRTTWAGSPLEQALRDAQRPVMPIALPGHARHGVSHRAEDYTDIAEQLRAELENLEAVDAVGYSLGGKLLLATAAADPSRFRRLVVAGVGSNAFQREASAPIVDALLDGPNENTPPLIRRLVGEARATDHDLHGLAAVISRPSHPIEATDLAAVRCEVLLVCGSADIVAGSVEPLAHALPRSRVHVVEGLDHLDTPRSTELAARAVEFLTAP